MRENAVWQTGQFIGDKDSTAATETQGAFFTGAFFTSCLLQWNAAME